jgi:D-alanine-D-alanine ligase
MTDRSLVHTHSELMSQVEHVVSSYRQPAIVQSFIAGYEIQISLVGTETPYPLGYTLLTVQDEVGGRREWIRRRDWDDGHVSFQPFTDRRICARLYGYCKRLYRALDLQDYGRLDYRLTPQGKVYFIESSTHPHLTRRSSFFTAAQSRGHDFVSMIELLIFESGTRQGLSLSPPRIPCP